MEDEAGNVYLRARLYDPTIGRFLTRDTYEGTVEDPQSLNLYTYCKEDPVMYTDSAGKNYVATTGKINPSVARVELLGSAYLYLVKLKGYTLAYDMFKQGLYGEGKSQEFGQSSLVAQEVMNSSELNKAINNYISKANKSRFSYSDRSIEFTSSRDLYYAIQHANYNVSGKYSNKK